MIIEYTEEKLREAVAASDCYKDVVEAFGRRAIGGNYRILKRRLKEWNISTDHFPSHSERTKRLWKEGKYNKGEIPLADVLVENSTYTSSHSLKKKLYKHGVKQRRCEMCGQDEKWQGKKMSLILDHINGVHNDNRLSNLRIVCPNCNATLPTHSGKNVKGRHPENYCECGKKISATSKKCRSCNQKERKPPTPKERIEWPTDDELARMVWETPRVKLAEILGVSDRAISKRCSKKGISQPPRGYWRKLRTSK